MFCYYIMNEFHFSDVYRSVNSTGLCAKMLPYFFGYKTGFFSFQNNTKDVDPSCKMDLDLWDCLGRGQLVL